MKIQKILMTRSKDVGKNLQKCPQNVIFPISDSQDFFQKSGFVTFVPSWQRLSNGRTNGWTWGPKWRHKAGFSPNLQEIIF